MNSKSKNERLEAVRQILSQYSGSTQEEICSKLESLGIVASQSTVSRDLREIGAIKFPRGDGGTSYRLSQGSGEENGSYSLYDASFETVGNLIVVKTRPGNAPGFCVELDNKGWKEIAGTIAGDDTILVIGRNAKDIEKLSMKLEIMIKRIDK
jgi:transcriptional regulator of arginine metabolism